MDPEGSHMGSHFCEECEIAFNITSHFARHLYAHTFIKIEEDDMPCICADCGYDFIGKNTAWSEWFLCKVAPPELKISPIMYFVTHNFGS